MAYVLKLTDPQYPDYRYCEKGSIPCSGRISFFLEDSTFATSQEATDYIKVLLDSGWYRPDITPTNFEVVEVKKYPGSGSFYYTEDYYKKIEAEEYSEKVLAAVKELKELRKDII